MFILLEWSQNGVLSNSWTNWWASLSPAASAEVKISGKTITRDALVNNRYVLTCVINHLGSRVSVDVLQLHIQSLYEHMKLEISSAPLAMVVRYDMYVTVCRYTSIYTMYTGTLHLIQVLLPILKPGICGVASRSITTSCGGHTCQESWQWESSWLIRVWTSLPMDPLPEVKRICRLWRKKISKRMKKLSQNVKIVMTLVSRLYT